jgi:hypothetical protein
MQQALPKDAVPAPSALAFGTPAEVRKVLLDYEAADCDQMILIAQFGKMKHEDICDSLELFGKEVLPEFMEREEKRARQKAALLEPVIEAAMKRRVEPQTPWYNEEYSYKADGSMVRHWGYSPELMEEMAKKATPPPGNGQTTVPSK